MSGRDAAAGFKSALVGRGAVMAPEGRAGFGRLADTSGNVDKILSSGITSVDDAVPAARIFNEIRTRLSNLDAAAQDKRALLSQLDDVSRYEKGLLKKIGGQFWADAVAELEAARAMPPDGIAGRLLGKVIGRVGREERLAKAQEALDLLADRIRQSRQWDDACDRLRARHGPERFETTRAISFIESRRSAYRRLHTAFIAFAKDDRFCPSGLETMIPISSEVLTAGDEEFLARIESLVGKTGAPEAPTVRTRPAVRRAEEIELPEDREAEDGPVVIGERVSSLRSRELYPKGLLSVRRQSPGNPLKEFGPPTPLPPGPHPAKIYLPISASKQDAAMSLGAYEEEDHEFKRGTGRSIYVHRAMELTPFQDMLPLAERATLKPFEVDMIPESSWGASLANILSRASWDRVRQPIFRETSWRCEICGERGGVDMPGISAGPVDCHEIWDYHAPGQTARGVQRLSRLMALCKDCHAIFHLAHAKIVHKEALAVGRLMAVNRWSSEETGQYIAGMNAAWEQRSRVKWALDLSQFAPGPGDFLILNDVPHAREAVILGARYKIGNEPDIFGPVDPRDYY